MKIAVVGTGISGLVSAHRLASAHDVEVFESANYVGGHTATVDVDVPSGRYAVDTGFIVFNDWTYPHFIALMNELGVKSQATSMSFSVKTEAEGLEYNGTNLNGLFAQRGNLLRPRFLRMIRDILRFNRESVGVLGTPEADEGLGHYLRRRGYTDAFKHHYIVPMGAAIWSASVRQMEEFPIGYFVQFFKNHGMLSVDDRPTWRVICSGSRSYIEPLTRGFRSKIHLNTPVLKVERRTRGSGRDTAPVRVTTGGPSGQASSDFDAVIFASHADQTLSLIDQPTAFEAQVLSEFRYQENSVVLHTDEAVLPRRRRAWAAWNYFVPRSERQTVAVTYDMNILQGIRAPETFCVSLNLEDQINPQKILRSFTYHHPVYSLGAVRAQARWSEVSGGQSPLHFCGAYWGYGFHEDGVKSGLRVAEHILGQGKP